MKQIFSFLLLATFASASFAQTTTYRIMRVKKSDGTITKIIVDEIDSIDFVKEAYVDLGLPSGTLWALSNIGSTAPEDYGDYFAWGETTTKETYEWGTYKYCNISDTTMTKYLTPDNTFNGTNLENVDDAAIANWGGTWRMPTQDDFNELRTECTWTWTTLNGISGSRVTGKNGMSIFLPAAGYLAGTTLYYTGEEGYYWLASLHAYSEKACVLHFALEPSLLFGLNRFVGLPIRPVCSNTSSQSVNQNY